MATYSSILASMIPVFGVMGIGALLRRTGGLNEQSDRSILRMVIHVFTPCLILTSLLGNPATADRAMLLWAPLLGIVTTALSILTCWLLAPLFGLTGPRRQVFAVTTGLCNYAYIPIPLILSLFDKTVLGVLFLVNVGVELALWVLGPLLLDPKQQPGAWKKVFNAPFYAIVLGVLITLAGWTHAIPPTLVRGMQMLGQCAVPMALLMIGAVMFDHFQPGASWKGVGTASGSVIMRLALLPIGLIALVVWLPCDLNLKKVLIIQAAMPAASFPIILVRRYGGDVPTSLSVLLTTSIFSLALSPYWISMGISWLNRM